MKCIDGKERQFRVHRLVASLFCENDDPVHKKVVNHIDMDKTNNKAVNLEWCTQSYNVKEGYRLRKNKRAKSYPIRAINKITGEQHYFKEMKDAENFVRGLRGSKQPRTIIRDACNGKYKAPYGFYWEFVKDNKEELENEI